MITHLQNQNVDQKVYMDTLGDIKLSPDKNCITISYRPLFVQTL